MKKRFLSLPLLAIIASILVVGIVFAALAIVRSNDVTVSIVATPQYTLTISAPTTVYSGNAFTVTGALTTSNGAAIDGKTISFYKGTDWQPPNIVTNTDGTFTKDIWGMDTGSTGDLIIHAEFQP